MKSLKRNIVVTQERISENLCCCQASFNSDNCITLRNYDRRNPNNDEIIILSYEETRAIFSLFSRFGEKNRNYNLPF